MPKVNQFFYPFVDDGDEERINKALSPENVIDILDNFNIKGYVLENEGLEYVIENYRIDTLIDEPVLNLAISVIRVLNNYYLLPHTSERPYGLVLYPYPTRVIRVGNIWVRK